MGMHQWCPEKTPQRIEEDVGTLPPENLDIEKILEELKPTSVD
jgi:hypothetical protein